MKRAAKRPKQMSMLKGEKSAYGGDLRKTRAGRRGARPLSTRETMHLVLRSTKAKGEWSFRRPKNEANISRIVSKFAMAYGVRVISMANVGNHLHLQIKLANRFTYPSFIRAVTGAIAMAITGRSRWTKVDGKNISTSMYGTQTASKRDPAMASKKGQVIAASEDRSDETTRKEKFWDYRPFTRIVKSLKAFLNLKDYVRINQLEGYGYKRDDARFMLKVEKFFARVE